MRLLYPRIMGPTVYAPAAGGTFSPSDISGLQLWLKADGTLWQDSARTTTASADTDPVGSWDDASGNANHAQQSTSGRRPLLRTAQINSKPAVRPDATDDRLVLGTKIALTGAFTLYAVGTRATGTNWIPLAQETSAPTVNDGALLIFNDNNLYVINNANSLVSAAVTVNGTVALRIRRDGSNVVKAALNGTAEFTVGTLSGTISFDNVGARNSNTQYNGGTNQHGEMALYNVATAGADDSNWSTYINGRWGVTLP